MKKIVISSMLLVALICSYDTTYSNRTRLTVESESEVDTKDLQRRINNLKTKIQGRSYSANKMNSLHRYAGEALEAVDAARDKQSVIKNLDTLHNSLTEPNIKTSKLLVVEEKVAKLEKSA